MLNSNTVSDIVKAYKPENIVRYYSLEGRIEPDDVSECRSVKPYKVEFLKGVKTVKYSSKSDFSKYSLKVF